MDAVLKQAPPRGHTEIKTELNYPEHNTITTQTWVSRMNKMPVRSLLDDSYKCL